MEVLQGIAFLLIEVVLLIVTILAMLKTGLQRLESSVGMARDGFPPGKPVPSWKLPDSTEQERETPSNKNWQLLLFVDHALVSFPELFAGIKRFTEKIPELEVIVLSRDDREICNATIRVLELSIPIVPVNQAFYDHFRVRVMPFAFLLDNEGIVRNLGLVNTEAQLHRMWQMAQAEIGASSFPQERPI